MEEIEKTNLNVIFQNGTNGNQNNNKYKTTKQATNHRYQLSIAGFGQIWNIKTSFNMLLYKKSKTVHIKHISLRSDKENKSCLGLVEHLLHKFRCWSKRNHIYLMSTLWTHILNSVPDLLSESVDSGYWFCYSFDYQTIQIASPHNVCILQRYHRLS